MSFQLRLPFNKLLFLTCILNVLFAVEALAIDVTDDIVGIYGITTSYYKGTDKYITYITVHRHEEQYVIINISQDLTFLRMLSLIKYQVAPLPIEEFAITFSTENLELSKPYLIEPLVLKENYDYSTIIRAIMFRKEDNFYYACVGSDGRGFTIEGLYRLCYKKLF